MQHKTIYEDPQHFAVALPLIQELQEYNPGSSFPLVEDPVKTKRTSIIGMFVLRPATHAWSAPVSKDSLYHVKDWAFNLKGLDGGWLIAAGSTLDAYRLALQYGVSDAVLVGSTTAAKEGVDGEHPGYLWQPYGPTSWDHLHKADPQLLGKIMKQRLAWQQLGYLSPRQYPAQIIITQSGEHRPGTRDILEARIFHASHPDHGPIEAYILTSETGASRIRERAGQYGLAARIEDILIPLSPPGNPDLLDIPRVPDVLYDKYDIRIANHDGGQTVLSEFSKAGVLPQMNLTLGRQQSVYHVLEHSEKVDAKTKEEALAQFNKNIQYFFSGGSIPKELVPAQILADNEVAVIAFDSRKLRGL